MTARHRLAEIDALFQAVLDTAPEERERLLTERAVEDPELVREVRVLLDYDRKGHTLSVSFDAERLVVPGLGLSGGVSAGDRVGAYRVIRELARGGMGIVWLGERADGAFEQRVALKVLPAGYLSANAKRRFERERQILAHLNHDNIARLLDGGVDERGRPFLAMELVEGSPIGEHCDRERLPLTERLRLVVSAARAVQSAHRNLIVHCDLKPANILVTGEGVVKLLDFGIAELLDRDSGEEPGNSEIRLLTPAYASPESLAGETITTSADVYQLGLLVYEIACGRRARHHGSDSPAALRREVSGSLPPAPSDALLQDGPGGTAEEIAASRGTTVPRLRRALAGDLDAIVLEAMAVDPDDRYDSAEDLARDLERYLEGRPVEARNAGWIDRGVKTIRRHPAIFALAVTLSLLACGLVYQTRVAWQERDRAEQEARVARSWAKRTQQVSDFLVSMLTDASLEDIRGDVTVVELLGQGVRRVRSELEVDSAARAELEEILGRVYDSLGRPDDSLSLLTDAVARKRSLGEAPAELAESILHLAKAHNDLGHHERTRELLVESLALQREVSGEGTATLEMAASLSLLSYVHGMLGELGPMLALREESLQIRESLFGSGHLVTAQGLNDLCFAYKDIGEYERAAALCRRAVAIRRQNGEEELAMASLNNLARVEVGLGRLEEAEAHNGEALAWALAHYPREHPWCGRLFATRGMILMYADRLEGAVAALTEARRIFEAVYPEDHRQLAWLEILFAQAETRSGDPRLAEANVRRALELLRRDHGEDQHTVLQGRIVLAETLLAQGRKAEARAELEDAERRLRPGRSEDEIWLRRARNHLAGLAPGRVPR